MVPLLITVDDQTAAARWTLMFLDAAHSLIPIPKHLHEAI